MRQITTAYVICLLCLYISGAVGESETHLKKGDTNAIDSHSDGIDRHRELFFRRRSRSSTSRSKRRFRNRISVEPIRDSVPPHFTSSDIESEPEELLSRQGIPALDTAASNPFKNRRRKPPRRKMARPYHRYGYYYAYSCRDSSSDSVSFDFGYDSRSSDSYDGYYDYNHDEFFGYGYRYGKSGKGGKSGKRGKSRGKRFGKGKKGKKQKCKFRLRRK